MSDALGDPRAKLEPHFHSLDTRKRTRHRNSSVMGNLKSEYVGVRAAAAMGWFGEVPSKVLAFDYSKDGMVGFKRWTGVGDGSQDLIL